MILFKASEVKDYPLEKMADVLKEASLLSGNTWEKAGGIPGFLSEMREADEDEE